MKCKICGRVVAPDICDSCYQLKEALNIFQPEELIVVTDGSFNDQNCSAAGGIVIADRDEQLIHCMGVLFECKDSNVAELFAINIAHRLMSGVVVWADNFQAVEWACANQLKNTPHKRFDEFRACARIIPSTWRDGLHELAHQVANMARKGQWRHQVQLESMYAMNRKRAQEKAA